MMETEYDIFKTILHHHEAPLLANKSQFPLVKRTMNPLKS
jgi:hypothetical protein